VSLDEQIRKKFAKFGKQGGATRASNMTAAERKAAARRAAQARWGKSKKTPK
jgi:hypothetical protein